jgi:anti-sigma B factor antagonist
MDGYSEFFTLETIAAPGAVTIRVRGEIDLATAPKLEACLLDVGDQVVVLDLSGVTFCDGAGLRVLGDARDRLDEQLRVRGSSEHLRKLARILAMEWLAEDLVATADGDQYGEPPS